LPIEVKYPSSQQDHLTEFCTVLTRTLLVCAAALAKWSLLYASQKKKGKK